MKDFFYLTKNDLRVILRDYSLVMLLFVPLLIAGLLRWGYPHLLAAWPQASDYNMLILCMLSITAGVMPGMAIAFVVLDEKDNGLLPVLMILPVSIRRIILCRALLIYIYAAVAAFLVLICSNLFQGQVWQALILSLLAASPSVSLGLIPAFFADNKIEGATLAKLLNFVLILPLPALLFEGSWTMFFMVLPPWWIYKSFVTAEAGVSFLMPVGMGMALHALMAAGIIRYIFRRRLYLAA